MSEFLLVNFIFYVLYWKLPGAVFSYKLRYIVGFWLVEMVISTNQKPTIYRNLYENTGPEWLQATGHTREINHCVLHVEGHVDAPQKCALHFMNDRTTYICVEQLRN